MTFYGDGNYTITARSGRKYLVAYSGRNLNSSVFEPGQWSHSPVLGLSWYPRSGTSLGGGSARWVDLKARWVIARRESVLRRNRNAWRFIDLKSNDARLWHESS